MAEGIVNWGKKSEFYGIQGFFCPFYKSFSFLSLGVTALDTLDVRMQPPRKRLPQILADGLDWM